jgi:hypothetical protein
MSPVSRIKIITCIRPIERGEEQFKLRLAAAHFRVSFFWADVSNAMSTPTLAEPEVMKLYSPTRPLPIESIISQQPVRASLSAALTVSSIFESPTRR